MKIGDIIGDRYYLKEILGQGAGGIVYLALDNRLYKSVAVKVLHTDNAEQVRQEVMMQKKLNHPVLPLLLDVVEVEQKCCIVMEFVKGETLDAYLEKNGALMEKQAVTIALQLLDVLEYMHTRRPPVIYQDLKPSNIMLCPDGSIKLIDLGISSYRYYDGRKMAVAGTKGYASPEQLAGDSRRIGVQSDLYSFGAVLYSMLTGIRLQYPPYRMDSIRVLFPHVSPQIAAVIEGCTAGRLQDRYKDVRDVREAVLSIRKVRRRRRSKKEKLRYTARVKSVFLSAKRYAGLWTVLLLLCAEGIFGGDSGGVLQDMLARWGIMSGAVLPVTVYNKEGQKVLIKYGSVYDLEGSFLVEVPKESLIQDATTTLRITVSGPHGSARRERVFLLNSIQ